VKWKLYDDLISAVPENLVIADCLAGLSWFLVRSAGTGIAMRPGEIDEGVEQAGRIRGRRVKEVASWIKSWNWNEAALGLAAINSALNAPDVARIHCGNRLDETANSDVFRYLHEDLKGKRVAVVGHFHGLEKLASVCRLSILERRPQTGDYPDPACEYILGDQDVVIMTATTLINKTMPRLLELSRNARIVVAGPSTPLHPLLFEYGVDLLGGLTVHEDEQVWRTVAEGGRKALFSAGSRMVKVSRQPEDGRTPIA
jgi:uncharacterized protein